MTQVALQRLQDDPRLRYEKSNQRGLARGRNAGIEKCRGEIIALTDDDCQTPANWLSEIVAAFASDERMGIVLGNAVAAPHDATNEFIQSYIRETPFLACDIRAMNQIEGIGGCMGIRRNLETTR